MASAENACYICRILSEYAVNIDVQDLRTVQEHPDERIVAFEELLAPVAIVHDHKRMEFVDNRGESFPEPGTLFRTTSIVSHIIVAIDMTNIIAFSLEGLWRYTRSMPRPSFMSLNAMQFVISIATILSNVIDAVLARMPGVRVIADRLCWKMISVSTDYNREDDCMMIRGYEGASKEFFRYLEQLDVFPGLLLGHK